MRSDVKFWPWVAWRSDSRPMWSFGPGWPEDRILVRCKALALGGLKIGFSSDVKLWPWVAWRSDSRPMWSVVGGRICLSRVPAQPGPGWPEDRIIVRCEALALGGLKIGFSSDVKLWPWVAWRSDSRPMWSFGPGWPEDRILVRCEALALGGLKIGFSSDVKLWPWVAWRSDSRPM